MPETKDQMTQGDNAISRALEKMGVSSAPRTTTSSPGAGAPSPPDPTNQPNQAPTKTGQAATIDIVRRFTGRK